MSNLRTFSAI